MARPLIFPEKQAWDEELKDIICAASGGFLFGIPLIYTMEVWWIGSYTQPPLMLLVLAAVFVVVFLLNRTDGFRQISPDKPLQAFMDSIEALAISIICVTWVLVLLREVTLQTPLDEALGKIIFEAVPFALGVGLARSVLSGRRDANEDADSDQKNPSQKRRYNPTLADLGATLVGATIIAFNIAPTDEVPMLASATSALWLIAIILTSLLVSYGIVFAAGFTTQDQRLKQQGAFQNPIVETVMAYLVSLAAAAVMLWFFHRLSPADPWTSWLEQVILLGLPSSIGGAAGRLAV